MAKKASHLSTNGPEFMVNCRAQGHLEMGFKLPTLGLLDNPPYQLSRSHNIAGCYASLKTPHPQSGWASFCRPHHEVEVEPRLMRDFKLMSGTNIFCIMRNISCSFIANPKSYCMLYSLWTWQQPDWILSFHAALLLEYAAILPFCKSTGVHGWCRPVFFNQCAMVHQCTVI